MKPQVNAVRPGCDCLRRHTEFLDRERFSGSKSGERRQAGNDWAASTGRGKTVGLLGRPRACTSQSSGTGVILGVGHREMRKMIPGQKRLRKGTPPIFTANM